MHGFYIDKSCQSSDRDRRILINYIQMINRESGECSAFFFIFGVISDKIKLGKWYGWQRGISGESGTEKRKH